LRFLDRVFHPREASHILGATDPDRALWIMWTAKEAAYKVFSKILSEKPVFGHARFVVRLTAHPNRPGSGFSISGSVSFEDHTVPFRCAADEQRIHTIAWSGANPDGDPPDFEIATGEAHVAGRVSDGIDAHRPFDLLLTERFTARERSSIHSAPSAYVRLFARAALAEALDVDEKRLEVVCGDQPTGRTPPRLYLDGRESPLDVSLSHHGARVGWAYTLTRDASVHPR